MPFAFDANAIVENAMRSIYETGNLVVEPTLFDFANRNLQHGVDDVFAKAGTVFGQQNAEFIRQFKYNTGAFAAFKAHEQTEKMMNLLVDEKTGRKRSFAAFRKEAEPIATHHNRQWLQTEYNTAVASARAGANWQQFQRTKHLYPNLEYMPTRSAKERADHHRLVGTVRPIDDDFWRTHMPPSAYGCKHSVQATRKAVTPLPDNLPDVPPEFQFNPGIEAMPVKIDKHPYARDIDRERAKKVMEWYHSKIIDTAKTIEEAEYMAKKILGFANVNYNELNVNFANTINKRIFELQKLYPDNKIKGVLMRDSNEMSGDFLAEYRFKDNVIWLNKKWWTKDVFILSKIKELIDENAFVKCDAGSVEYAITHEFGHGLFANKTENLRSIYLRYIDDTDLESTHPLYISEYSFMDPPYELGAEVFCYYLYNKKPNKYVNEIINLLKP